MTYFLRIFVLYTVCDQYWIFTRFVVLAMYFFFYFLMFILFLQIMFLLLYFVCWFGLHLARFGGSIFDNICFWGVLLCFCYWGVLLCFWRFGRWCFWSGAFNFAFEMKYVEQIKDEIGWYGLKNRYGSIHITAS